jgi:hypothetical protein
VCKLNSLLSVICCLLSKHWCWFRGTSTSSSGRDPLSEFGKEGKFNSKYMIGIYHFMLLTRVGLGSNWYH